MAIGFSVLVGTAASAVILGGGWWIAPIGWLPIACWIPWFFRDPTRDGPRGADLVLAPADGKVVSVKPVHEAEYIRGSAVRVSIFMNVFDVHVNRVPAGGSVEHRNYRPGSFVNATLDKASTDNEQMSLGIRCPNGPLLVRQIAGLVARRIVCDHLPGAEVRQGERLGLIRFGSRVDTFLPDGAAVRVDVGDRTVAGCTIIAEWPSGGEQ